MAFAAPFAIPLLIGATVLSTAFSVMGQMQAGAQAQATADYNAKIEEQRAEIARQQAQAQAAIDQSNVTRKMGEAAAAYGAAGVDMTGTPLAVMSDLATQGELTRRLTLFKGDLSAMSDRQQGALDVASGDAARTASFFSAGSSLLTGVARAGTLGFFGSSSPGTPLSVGHELAHA